MQKKNGKQQQPRWLATSPGKRWTELFFLYYSVIWITFFGGIVVTKAYESFDEWSYMKVGFTLFFPCFLGPLLFPGQGEPSTPFWDRYFVKANIWIFILSFIGNYFWTHYFYNLLGAAYTFKAHRINDVPISFILITHAYFCTYHTLTTIALRRFWTSSWYKRRGPVTAFLVSSMYIAAMAYFTAFMETLTISSVKKLASLALFFNAGSLCLSSYISGSTRSIASFFFPSFAAGICSIFDSCYGGVQYPYYTFKDRRLMYLVGSACYGIYFIVSFPMYYRLCEHPGARWPLGQVAIDSLGGCMLVTVLLDFWRLGIGGIVENVPQCVPWM